MKQILFFSFFLLVLSCSKSEKENNINAVETYFSQSKILPTYNGCCAFSTILQIKDNVFRHYYLNNQGDYTTIDIIDGEVIKENDSVFYLKPKLDSIDQQLSFDSKEFFKQKFTKNKFGIRYSNSLLAKKTFNDIKTLSLKKTIFENPFSDEEFTLKKDSLIYDKFKSFEGKSPEILKRKLKLNHDEKNGIKIVFDENFWIEKPVEKEGIHTYSYINFGDESFQIPLNTKIQEYFFVQFKK